MARYDKPMHFYLTRHIHNTGQEEKFARTNQPRNCLFTGHEAVHVGMNKLYLKTSNHWVDSSQFPDIGQQTVQRNTKATGTGRVLLSYLYVRFCVNIILVI